MTRILRVAEHYEKSDTGRQRRANEDAFYARAPLFVVADGMGGAQAGEVASRIAVESFERGLPDADATPAERRLAERVEEANRAIHDLSRTDADRAGMGTTITAALVEENGVAIAHVGDSRAYLLRDGRLGRLTDDHSLVEELMRQGKLSAEEAGEHPQRSIITRALGPEPFVRVDTRTVPARDGDVLLLCSDGLTSMVDEGQIQRLLDESPTLADAGRRLVAAANDAGGRDNITVILFRVEDVGGARPAEQPTEVSQAIPAQDATTAGAGAAAGPATATAAPPRTAAVAQRRPRERGPAAPPARRRRRRAPRPLRTALIVLCIVVPVAIGLWVVTTSVYFIGTNDQGLVTLYRGLPWELPGIKLYSPEFVSGVPAVDLPPAPRHAILDHRLRGHNDAVNEVRRIELGQVEGMP